jgi:hypothetical protein
MDFVINESGRYLLLVDSRDAWIPPPEELRGRLEVHRLCLVVILRFTIKLLTYGTNKDVYNSVQVCFCGFFPLCSGEFVVTS